MRLARLISGCSLLLPLLLGASDWQVDSKSLEGKLTESSEMIRIEKTSSTKAGLLSVSKDIAESEKPVAIRFSVRSPLRRIVVNLTDSDGQVHEHSLPLIGKGEWEDTLFRVVGSSDKHRGGKNDGVFRPPLRKISIAGHCSDKAPAWFEIKSFQLEGAVKPEKRSVSVPLDSYWSKPNPDRATLDCSSVDSIKLNCDFTSNTKPVSIRRNLPVPTETTEVTFMVRSPARGVDLCITGSDQQTHWLYTKLSGNPNEVQTLTVPAVGSPKYHMGGNKDGVLYQPLRAVGFSVDGRMFPAKQGTLEVLGIQLTPEAIPDASQCAFEAVAPEKFFRSVADQSPHELKLLQTPDVSNEIIGKYIVTDYQGNKLASGSNAQFDSKRMVLSVPAYPGYEGFLEYLVPGLGIRFGVMQTNLPEKPADEFFAVDSSFSWGKVPLSEARIRSYCRILKKNGIIWNRDRLRWGAIVPKEDVFNFGGQFELYHKIATEEGIKTLDTFHDTPAWLVSQRPASKFGPHPYPARLEASGKSWVEILRHYQNTLHALEVWNEPECGFGAELPSDRVASLTKAISYATANAKLNTTVVGGILVYFRPETNLLDTYFGSGILETSDVFSFHAYCGVMDMEPKLAELRDRAKKSSPSRAGIPMWITECGTPWKKGGKRAIVSEDITSAAGIVGKALEAKALGIERYFAFEYKYYQEGVKNYGMMDACYTPMRSMATYAFLARLLAGREYVGDLAGTTAQRARVFSDGKDAVVFLFVAKNNDTVVLPQGLTAQACGIDGRALTISAGKLRIPDQVAYLKIPAKALAGKLDTNTKAMGYNRIAKDFDRAPRQVAPVVFYATIDLSDAAFTPFGYNMGHWQDSKFDVELHNCSDQAQVVRPELELPTGVKVLEKPADSIEVAPGGISQLSFRVAFDSKEWNEYRYIRLKDQNQSALPLVLSVRPWEKSKLETPSLDTCEPISDVKSALSAKGWTNISGQENWVPWLDTGKKQPDIEARIRTFYGDGKLRVQVLVKDDSFHQPQRDELSWNGDSVQLVVQQRNADGMPPRSDSKSKRKWSNQASKLTVARVGKETMIYGHKGIFAGRAKTSKAELVQLDKEYWLYTIDLDAKEFKLELSKNGVLGFSLLVNSNSGSGRNGFLFWGNKYDNSALSELAGCLYLK